MWIVRLALRRPYTIAVLSALILLFGVMSAARMKVDIFPAIDIPVVIVVWNYPGLSAEDMERRIVLISERAYSTTVDGISHIDSQSISGLGILKVYFEPDADIGAAIAQIASVSQTASRIMPPGIQPPNVMRYNASNVPVAQVTVSSDSLPEQQLYDHGMNFMRVRLFTIPGMSIPAPYGGKARQIMVDVDPAKVAAKGLALQDVVQAVLQSNVLIPAGTVQIGQTEYNVKLNASPPSVDAFNALPVRVVDGAPVFLGDVARVRDSFAVQQNIVRVDGKRATYLTLLKHANASTLAVVDAAREMLPALQASAPEGMELKIGFDQSVFVRAAVKNVMHEALISSILVSLMILVFLGSWRSMLLVATSIPLAMAVGVGGLFLMGHTLNIMTLGGLALAIGMLVDDATVAVENIHRNRTLGLPLTPAILVGAEQIAVPALAATLTICIVFFPVVLLEGPSRFLFTPLALSVVISMMASYFLSRTLVPTLARMLLEHEAHGPEAEQGAWGRFNVWRDRLFDRFQETYARGLSLVLAHRGFVLGCAAALVACTAVLPFVVGLDFFPSVDAGQMRLHLRAPTGTRLEETEKLVEAVEQRIRTLIPPEELETINTNIGLPQAFNLAMVPTDNIGSQDAEFLIALTEHHRPTRQYMQAIRDTIPREFPGVSLYFQSADIVSQVLNFGLPAPIDIQIAGSDLDKSYELARELRDRLREIPGTTDVRIAQVMDHPAFNVEADRTRAAQLGITQRDVANNLLTTLSSSSTVSPSFWVNPQNNVNYMVAVQTPLPRMSTVGDLMSTPVSGGTAPLRQSTPRTVADTSASTTTYLGSLATLSPSQDKALINHATIQRVINVQASAEGRDLGSVTRDIEKAIAGLKGVPKTTRITVRGQSESMYSSFRSLGMGLLLAIVLVYLLMVVLFQSWMDPFIIMAAVPGALVGILWMLAATGTTLNVESFMGSIMAVGIAVSNSILLVNFANDVRVERGLSALEAALEAGRTRLRPILMTALAMIIGMVPMALALGEGGEQNAPLGRAVIGGLLAATVTTLFFVPVVYSLLRKAPPRQHELDQRFEAESALVPSPSSGSHP
ncbi:efflux RND transporter permease subunit [Vitiosangium sp. GDMCC 1.1324]|uniref:efflux RND transporter permease subunit n=1 Tax=Vitiosangium sp. (strain GDMCC 1.1324) TaxID=2138576 RepID=UPI000D39EFE3|nr:efflux RND transporter permease subunit [Vitiosangium sp. GDMCC 1.1324]PTL75200.1 RND transporter [Vitiosangium sp. GDMCC 1.1324]